MHDRRLERRPRLPDHHHLHRRPGARRGADARALLRAARATSCTCGSTRSPAAPAAAAPRTPAPTRAHARRYDRRGRRCPSPSNTNTTTDAVNRDYAVPTFEALESSSGFSSASVGYAGSASDGLTMLDSDASADHLHVGARRARDADRRAAPAARPQRQPGARLRHDRGQGGRGRPAPRSASRFDRVRARLRAAVAPLRRRPAPPRRAARPGRGPRVLRVGQRRQGQRGQDVPGRDRRRAGLAVGPVGAGRQLHQRRADVLRLLPRGVRARPVRGVHRPARRRRHPDRAGRRRASCSTASSRPTARCRATRCSTASRRPTPAVSSSTRPRIRS